MSHSHIPSVWDHPDAEARLAQLWAARVSATSCAAILAQEFGVPVTRNAIMGKTWRLKLRHPVDVRAASKPPRPPRRRRKIPMDHKIRPPRPIPIAVAIPNKYNRQLIELENCSCRWPFGDPTKSNFFFCGMQEANTAAGKAYCDYHTKLATA